MSCRAMMARQNIKVQLSFSDTEHRVIFRIQALLSVTEKIESTMKGEFLWQR
jgi:hypothetical protein